MVMTIWVLTFPILIVKYLYLDTRTVDRKEFRSKYGSLTLDLQLREKPAILYNVVFMVKRIIFALIIVTMPEFSWGQT